MTDRCEPPEHLRGEDGWHVLLTRDGKEHYAFWEHRMDARGLEWGERNISPRDLHQLGWRYIAPVTTPKEVAALRAERDALLAEKAAYESPAWEANERLNTEAFRRDVELATLRARVKKLDAVLAEYKLLFCEGYCTKIPGTHEDCSGCLARITLEGKSHD